VVTLTLSSRYGDSDVYDLDLTSTKALGEALLRVVE
jgi:hypothetical protein